MIEIIAWALLVNEGNIFLLKKNTELNQEWTLIGGHVDAGESIKSGLKREILEESGVIVQEKDLRFQYIIDRKLKAKHRIHFFFIAEAFEGNPYNKENNTHIAGEWHLLNNLPANLGPLATRAIQSMDNEIIYEEYGW
jgi:8-oxo-dGTP diphosphatase